ncbi:UxaA family hydrolase [Alicyclobacillus fodiniaquatilis]|uniref:UxaA family hydrolase n=1 Tax=Alicyclobacillus fodiniaquatilis TaxID=1661150 RepID=A0ABW4JBG8_9BACL
MNQVVQLHPEDDVVVAVRNFFAGESIRIHNQADETIILNDDVMKGHKIAICPIKRGMDVHKFGYSIGRAKTDILIGSWVHTHNLETGLDGIEENTFHHVPEVPATESIKVTERVFQGYVRPNGEVGIRNEIWILNTVGCINKTCEIFVKEANVRFHGRVDGVYHFPHPFGCSQLGDDLAHTQRLLASLAEHPNAAGVLVVGLGCENNQIDSFRGILGEDSLERIRFLKVQEVDDEIEAGLDLIEELVEYAEQFVRERVPIAKLKIGLKCGGSDGFSGITANPLVGLLSDVVVSEGGTTILTEVPEMFGAETILMNRAVNDAVYQKIVSLINDFKQYFLRHGQQIYENPSPGNKQGGITTLEEKSLGCTQKGGHATVVDVIPYGHRVSQTGLNLLQAPGNDLVSVTALAAAGAHVVLFTTGRGTPFGGPVPTVKISTNSDLALRKTHWIDFDAGPLLEGVPVDTLRDSLFDFILSVASGDVQTASERGGYREIAIFKDGVTL